MLRCPRERRNSRLSSSESLVSTAGAAWCHRVAREVPPFPCLGVGFQYQVMVQWLGWFGDHAHDFGKLQMTLLCARKQICPTTTSESALRSTPSTAWHTQNRADPDIGITISGFNGRFYKKTIWVLWTPIWRDFLPHWTSFFEIHFNVIWFESPSDRRF